MFLSSWYHGHLDAKVVGSLSGRPRELGQLCGVGLGTLFQQCYECLALQSERALPWCSAWRRHLPNPHTGSNSHAVVFRVPCQVLLVGGGHRRSGPLQSHRLQPCPLSTCCPSRGRSTHSRCTSTCAGTIGTIRRPKRKGLGESGKKGPTSGAGCFCSHDEVTLLRLRVMLLPLVSRLLAQPRFAKVGTSSQTGSHSWEADARKPPVGSPEWSWVSRLWPSKRCDGLRKLMCFCVSAWNDGADAPGPRHSRRRTSTRAARRKRKDTAVGQASEWFTASVQALNSHARIWILVILVGTDC